jgi:uncharacterized membrane protein (DUF485 family)
MTDEGSAAYNPEHEDDRIERKIADQPSTKPHRWVNRIVLAVVLLGVVYVTYLVSAAFFPRWWAQRVADQVDGSMARGTMWGLFYGFVFTAIPVLVLVQARRRFLSWTWRGVVVLVAVVLAVPNWLTLAVVVANSSAAHAGERIMDVDAPGFRGATVIGAVVGALVALAITAAGIRLKGRRNEVKRLRGERDELRRARGVDDESR